MLLLYFIMTIRSFLVKNQLHCVMKTLLNLHLIAYCSFFLSTLMPESGGMFNALASSGSDGAWQGWCISTTENVGSIVTGLRSSAETLQSSLLTGLSRSSSSSSSPPKPMSVVIRWWTIVMYSCLKFCYKVNISEHHSTKLCLFNL